MKRATVCLIILTVFALPTYADSPFPIQYHVWFPCTARQDPHAEKRKPQPHDIPAIDAILQPVDLPDYDLDPALSGDALTPQLRGIGAADAHKVMYWAQNWDTRPLTVYNIVVVFWDVDGARGYMHYLVDKCVELGSELVIVPPLADEATGCQQIGGMSDIYTVDYRYGNVVSGTGIDGTLDMALEYAALSLACVRRETEWN